MRTLFSLKAYIFLAIVLFAVSCSDDKTVTDSKIDASKVIEESGVLSTSSRQLLANEVRKNDADFVLFTYFNTDETLNSHVLAPFTSGGAFGISCDKDLTTEISLNDVALTATSPLVFPGYYYSEAWDLSKNYYSLPAAWKITHAAQTLEINSKFQDSIYRVTISNIKNDSISTSKSLYINWTKSENADNSTYISFDCYPTFSDAEFAKSYGCVKSEDTGLYMTELSYLSSLDLPKYGVLQVNVLRYNTEIETIGNYKILILNAAESSVCLYLK